MKSVYTLTTLTLGLALSNGVAADKVDFVKQVKPIFELNCVSCHGPKHFLENGSLDITTKAKATEGGDSGKGIVPGDTQKSLIAKFVALPADHKKIMPPAKHSAPLAKEEIAVIQAWVEQGAEWPDGVVLKQVMKVDFVRDIQPILEKGGPLDDEKKATLQLWIDQGAVWPANVKLGGAVEAGKAPRNAEMTVVEKIYQKIQANTKEQAVGDMKKYGETLDLDVKFEVVPVPAGEFLMGSPDSEPKRKADEGPQHKVKVDAFWMGKCEVTWDEYEQFMYPDQSKAKDTNYVSDAADATARPTKPYVEMSFGMGKGTYPAISMTQHAANKYCQWLSARTGHFYRLPTEAEWEYACRAGTTTAYSFGDDASQIGDYAWFTDNVEGEKYAKVGQKKPNPWGLYDMHGNVAEWCLDQYSTNFYASVPDVAVNPWNKATKSYPHVARGGSWWDAPEKLRSSARKASNKDWKQQDPQLPKSIWYHTDAQFLGFRIVRPLKTPTPDEMYFYWNNGVERD